MAEKTEIIDPSIPSDDLNMNNADVESLEKGIKGNQNVSEKDEFQHFDTSSFFFNFILRNLKANLDVLIDLQGTARKFFKSFVQEQIDVGWKSCTDSRFNGLKGTDLLVTLPNVLKKLTEGDLKLNEQVVTSLRTLMIWVGLKFDIEYKTENKIFITAYLFCKAEQINYPIKLTVFVPRYKDDIVPLVCIANEMVNTALKTFNNLMTTISRQLSVHGALPVPVVPEFKYPEFEPDETEEDEEKRTEKTLKNRDTKDDSDEEEMLDEILEKEQLSMMDRILYKN